MIVMDAWLDPATNEACVWQCGLIILAAIAWTWAVVFTIADIYRHRWMKR